MQVIMHWYRETPIGDPIADIEVVGSRSIEVPANACGFRLSQPGLEWDNAWYFAERGSLGAIVKEFNYEYSSDFMHENFGVPDSITAVGPVRGCAGQQYPFQFSPLNAFAVSGDHLLWLGAGAFVAEFFSESHIEWLDSAFKPIIKEVKPHEHDLPEDFFEDRPSIVDCIEDFDGKWYCKGGAHGGRAALAPPGELSSRPIRGVELPDLEVVVAANREVVPEIRAIEPPSDGTFGADLGPKVRVKCPVKLVLRAIFHKDYTFEPATVRYRFRFASGQVSTVFERLVAKDGPNEFVHTVPFPLPSAASRSGLADGGRPDSDRLAVLMEPVDRTNPSLMAPATLWRKSFQWLPKRTYAGSVRVEVVNAFEGIVVSEWTTFHFECIQGPQRRPPGVRRR